MPLYIYPPIPVEDADDAASVQNGVPSMYIMTDDPEVEAEAVTCPAVISRSAGRVWSLTMKAEPERETVMGF
jgi:hypothetical protein